MRGSPLVRTLFVLIALVLTALGLVSLSGPASRPATPTRPATEPGKTLATPFVLTLSAPASSIALESAGEMLRPAPVGTTLNGTLPLDPGQPTVFIDITWADTSEAPRFAKLVLEPPGQATRTHVFDASGPLSDVWELHGHDE